MIRLEALTINRTLTEAFYYNEKGEDLRYRQISGFCYMDPKDRVSLKNFWKEKYPDDFDYTLDPTASDYPSMSFRVFLGRY